MSLISLPLYTILRKVDDTNPNILCTVPMWRAMGRSGPLLKVVDDTVIWPYQAVVLDIGQEGQTKRMGLLWDKEDAARNFTDHRLWSDEDPPGTYVVQKIGEDQEISDLMQHLLDRDTEVFALNAPALEEGQAILMKCNSVPRKLFLPG